MLQFKNKLLPAITFETMDDVLPVAEAVLEGGLDVLEITFRTDIAANAVTRIRKRFPELMVGAGTLLSATHVRQARDAGAQFGLAPGFNPRILKEAKGMALPFVPGVMTPSEVEVALGEGCTLLKLFPCNLAGGVKMLQALQGPYGSTGVKFIPMGGINPSNLHEYVHLDMVAAVGGSWLVTKSILREKDYKAVTRNVQEALAVVNSRS